jgi:hypothetical protein
MKILLTVSLLFVVTGYAAEQEQSKPITPTDSLTVDGIPPISTDVVGQVGRYTEARAVAMVDWHPTRPEALILTRFADTNQVHLVSQPGGARTQLTFFTDRVTAATFDPTKGDFFLFSKSAGGNEFNQNYRYDLATGDVTRPENGGVHGKNCRLEQRPKNYETALCGCRRERSARAEKRGRPNRRHAEGTGHANLVFGRQR